MEASRKQGVQSRQLQLSQRVSQARHKIGSSMLQPRDSTVWQSRAEDRCGEWEGGVLRWSGRMLDGNDLLLAHQRLLDEFLSTNRGFSAFSPLPGSQSKSTLRAACLRHLQASVSHRMHIFLKVPDELSDRLSGVG